MSRNVTVSPDPDVNWHNNDIQFPRLIDECAAVLTDTQYQEIAMSMDLSVADVHELFERAQAIWDHIKAQTPARVR